MSNAKDLDAIVQANISVKLGGKEYILPGDIPIETYLKLNAAQELEDESEAKALDAMIEAMGELFGILYPEDDKLRIAGEVKAVLRKRGVVFTLTLVKNIYSKVDESPEEGEDKPEEVSPTPQEDGTPST